MNKIARKSKVIFSKLNHEKILDEIIISFNTKKITFDKIVKIQIFIKKLKILKLNNNKTKLLLIQDYIKHYLFNIMYINLTFLYNQMTDVNFIIKKNNSKNQQLYYYLYNNSSYHKLINNTLISKISKYHLFIMITNYKNKCVLVKIKDIYLYNLFFETFALMYQIKYKIFHAYETPYRIFNNFDILIKNTGNDSKLTMKDSQLNILEYKYIPINKNKNTYKNYSNNHIPGETVTSKLELNLLSSSSEKEKYAKELFYDKDLKDIFYYVN